MEMYVRPQVYNERDVVYLRPPEHENGSGNSFALKGLKNALGGIGPFTVFGVADVPTSTWSPQTISLCQPGESAPIMDNGTEVHVSSYWFTSEPQPA